MSDQYEEGFVDKWIGGNKRFGFITYQSSGREQRSIFSRLNPVDSLGRRGQVAFEGALVRFKIEQVVHKGSLEQSQRTFIRCFYRTSCQPVSRSTARYRRSSKSIRKAECVVAPRRR